jgi:hypothetical protein
MSNNGLVRYPSPSETLRERSNAPYDLTIELV